MGLKDEIEFIGATSYPTGGFPTRFGELSRVENVFLQPDDERIGATSSTTRALKVTAASPDANQITVQVYETDSSATTELSNGTDLSGITFYGMAKGS